MRDEQAITALLGENWRGWRTHLPALGVIALAVALGAAIWLHAAGPGAHAGTDFAAYLAGARAVATGHNPYHDLISQGNGTNAAGIQAHGYVYPPLLALVLAVPVVLGLPARAIWLLWTALNVAAVVWMGWELQRNLLPEGGKTRADAGATGVVGDAKGRRAHVGATGMRAVETAPKGVPPRSPPSRTGIERWAAALAFAAACLLPAVVTYDLWLGQADLLMAALAVGACSLWQRGHGWPAALVLALAIAVKPPLALVLLVWLWQGDWRTAVRGGLAAVALVALAFVPVGLGALHDYIVFFTQWNAFHADAEYINQSPYGMLLRMFTVNHYTRPLVVAPWLVLPLRLGALVGAVALWLRATPASLGEVRTSHEDHAEKAGVRRVIEGNAVGMSVLRAYTAFVKRLSAPSPAREKADPALTLGTQLLALPLIVLLSPLAEDIHFCLIVPALVALAYLAWQRGLARTPSAWALWLALTLFCLPRVQEIIYPTRFVPLPGQSDPHVGPLIALLRTGGLLAVAIVALAAGGQILRRAREVQPEKMT